MIKQIQKNLLTKSDEKMEIQLAPLRTLDDFILASSRFQIPDVQSPDRWFNRLVHNLMYYQSNYFLASFVIFIIVTFFHPHEMMFGLTVMGLLFGLSYYAQSRKKEVLDFKKKHPLVVTLVVFSVGYYLVYKMGSIVVFALGILLPFCFVVVHASLRLRNVKNKLSNATELLGLSKKTPMGLFLGEIGIEPELKAN